MDPARPIRKPAVAVAGDTPGLALSDDFLTDKMGTQWSFYGGEASDVDRRRLEEGSLVLRAAGTSPANSSPLWFVCGDQAYEIEVEFEIGEKATAGLLVFYSRRLYAGLGVSDRSLILHRYGRDRPGEKPEGLGRHGFLRVVNDRNLVSLYYSRNGRDWRRHDVRALVSGYNHHTVYDFLSLRPALYAAGEGEVRFRNFKYRALP
jgi:beta-xylosidase